MTTMEAIMVGESPRTQHELTVVGVGTVGASLSAALLWSASSSVRLVFSSDTGSAAEAATGSVITIADLPRRLRASPVPSLQLHPVRAFVNGMAHMFDFTGALSHRSHTHSAEDDMALAWREVRGVVKAPPRIDAPE